MDVEPGIGQTDGFPALDFKFHNQGSRKDLLTKVVIDVHRATVDYTPILGSVISCDDGDVVLYVSNNGWGDAEDFRCEVDLEPFGAAVQSRTVLVTAPKIPAEADSASTFVLVSHQQIDTSAMPSGLRKEEHRLPGPATSRYREPYLVPPDREPRGGIESLSSKYTYMSIDGRSFSERQDIRTHLYTKIYLQGTRFECVSYDPGIMASVLPPSCRYHFLLDPDQGARRYEKSIAHEVRPDEYERIWIVVASKKSAHYELKCRFFSSSGRTIESPGLQLDIWNPPSHAYLLRYGRELNEISYPANY